MINTSIQSAATRFCQLFFILSLNKTQRLSPNTGINTCMVILSGRKQFNKPGKLA
jgi:hypothetical protein